MGFWIYYKMAVRAEQKELKRIQRKFNAVINKNDGELNAFREYLNIKPGGEADYINPFRRKGNIISAWIGIRCNWMDPVALGYAIREKIGRDPEIYFLVDECELGEGGIEMVTNDASREVFAVECAERQVRVVEDVI